MWKKLISMTWVHYFVTCICALVLYPTSSAAQRLQAQRQQEMEAGIRYFELPYLISNFSHQSSTAKETLSLEEVLDKPIEGFYFYLKQDSLTGQTLMRQPDGTFTPFVEALTLIQKNLAQNPLKVMTLFLDYVVDFDLSRDLTAAGLQAMRFTFDPKQGWPSLAEMIQSNQRLVLFEVRPHLQSPAWLHSMSEYVLHTDPEWSNHSEHPLPFEERLKKTFALSAQLKNIEQFMASDDDLSSLARRTPFLIESVKRDWIRDGMVPNFLLINRYASWMELTLATLRSFHLVYGVITSNGDLLNYVNWKGLSNHTTGRFFLPVEAGSELLLEPSSPGYVIEPSAIRVKAEHVKAFVGEFKARPLAIQEGLQLHLPFDDTEKISHSQADHILNKGVEYIFDPMRGRVASFEQQSTIALPTAAELQLRDHDFTVAVWLKIDKYQDDKEDYCVLGSINNTYQRSLHLLIRNQKPYMGFFNNDLVGNTLIEEGKWYHIAWRYNKQNGEQAIFVNGRLDALSEDRPPFLGSDSLMVGIGLNGANSYFEGMMDNLSIWSRTLSDKEIAGLSNQSIVIPKTYGSSPLRYLYVIVALGLVLLLGWGIRHWRRRESVKTALTEELEPMAPVDSPNVPSTPTVSASPIVAADPQPLKEQPRNRIQLFGTFSVLDREGEEIAPLFTPKIKQLFLLLLIHSSRGGKGISSNALTEQIWGGEASSKNSKSLRSVSILKLRKILERLDQVEIRFTSNRYFLQFAGSVSCDYLHCLKLLEGPINDRTTLEQLITILSQGEVFGEESYAWLDDTKSYICNSAVDLLTRFIPHYSMETESDKLIRLADQILRNDPCNEEALICKVQALMQQNHTKSARYTYQRFTSLYEELYGEPFPKSFEAILSANGSGEASA